MRSLKRIDPAQEQVKVIIAECIATKSTSLQLKRLGLTMVPRDVFKISWLRKLDLSENSIEEIPKELARLGALTDLTLDHNKFKCVPEVIFDLPQLESLNLWGNAIEELPPEIGRLKNLRNLDLWDNLLQDIPSEISNLEVLEVLDLGLNQFSQFPMGVTVLRGLKKLVLLGNTIKTLPPQISRLSELVELNLARVGLSALPPELRALKHLRRLLIHDNPGLEMPDEVLGPPWGELISGVGIVKAPVEIIDYYDSTRGENGMALREVKLVVVGRGKAGKTTLIKRLEGGHLNPNEVETHGINISKLNLACYDGPMLARVWDFGGQHVLHAMHEFFLTARSLYLLVLSERDDMAERDAQYWLQLIRGYAGKAPVIVVFNKSRGLAPRPIDRATFEAQYGPIVAWVSTECDPTDCNGGSDGLKELRAAITEAAGEMNAPRAKFPAKWSAIKKWAENIQRPYVNYADFSQRCRELNEADPAMQEILVRLLHDLGIALNYGTDKRLRETSVLRPDWLANGIYAILRANILSARPLVLDGILTERALGRIYRAADLGGVLKVQDYPPEKWRFLLDLMGLFKLSFPLDPKGDMLLVPSLLGAEAPEGAVEPTGQDVLRFRYEFSVVPGPLLPRFIVSLFPLIDGRKCWRRGVMLRYVDSRAMIWCTQDERYIYVTVGSGSAREDLADMIRGMLKAQIEEYQNLNAVEQWMHRGHWVPRPILEEMGLLSGETRGYTKEARSI